MLRLAMIVQCVLALGACAQERGEEAEPAAPAVAAVPDDLRTVAETSDYRATSRYDEVVALMDRLARAVPEGVEGAKPLGRRLEMGKTVEGRSIPMLVVAAPPVGTKEEAAEAVRKGRMVVFLFGNIHAGEVDGKEALLMLARDLVTTKEHPLLKGLVVAIAPIYNCDGNERFGQQNRTEQVGPEEGYGVRENAMGLDLNRDFVKLEAPETRALVKFVREWDPAVMVDCHTTDGSFHQYLVTYAGPKVPAGNAAVISYVRDTMLPAVTADVEAKAGFKTFFYGNFGGGGGTDHTKWETFPAEPRYSTNWFGLRGRIGILSESYSHAPYKDRITGTRDFVRGVLDYASGKKDEIKKLVADADSAAVEAGKEPKEDDLIALRTEAAPFEKKVMIAAFVEKEEEGRTAPTDEKRDYEIEHWEDYKATLSVRRPFAYLYPAEWTTVTETLQRQGIQVEELREDIELDAEVYRVSSLSRARAFQEHELATVGAEMEKVTRMFGAGTIMVRTGQKLGLLAAYMLEPQSEDGLVTWNFFDASLGEGQEFAVARLPAAVPILSGAVRPLAEDRTLGKRIKFGEDYSSDDLPNLSGSATGGMTWLDDEHYLQNREGKLRKVAALTGRTEVFMDPEPMAAALGKLPTVGEKRGRDWAEGRLNFDKERRGAYFNHENDLYYASVDGSLACRLTSTPEAEELAAFSPDGEFVAFVRENDLYVVDVRTQTERRLTEGGTDKLRNGKADWVYYEEVFSRSERTYWWSPDSARLALLQIDSSPVRPYPLVDDLPEDREVEYAPFPKPGQPNPNVRIGIVSAAGGSVRWADLGEYTPASFLVTGAGWMPDSSAAYCYIQNRTQTWLDFCTVGKDGGKPTRLFRDSNGAWVDVPDAPEFLKDGSFLFASEKTGWRHYYHFGKDGKEIAQVTSGEWEARDIEAVDEEGGWLYFTGMKDNPIGGNLYRAKLDGTGLERLTSEPGSHNANVSKTGKLFVDSWSSFSAPTRVVLRNADGSAARTLDSNPVYALEEYEFGEAELVQIPAPDGFVIEGSLIKPPGFDPEKTYPVWFSSYAGPHAPTVSDSWGGGRTWDQAIASMGILVFHADPRSASGKGAVNTRACYKQLGVSELADIETAIKWLTANPWADAERVGISGWSYGGFMTAFAMTHSTLFSAGIAGGTVTDWRDYDTIYTERYMLTPEENPEGYDKTSVVKAAKDLHGRLLLVHGVMDDNVHAQNAWRFVRALQSAGKEFEMMFYPGARHGVGGGHYQKLQLEFIGRTMRPEKSEQPSDSEESGSTLGALAPAP
jgi:dipeptidyl-peptidase 4